MKPRTYCGQAEEGLLRVGGYEIWIFRGLGSEILGSDDILDEPDGASKGSKELDHYIK